jgi:glycosyltransferase involved in cell wall biosynthesis
VERVVVADNETAWPWPFERGWGLYLRWRKRRDWWDRDHLNKTKLNRRLRDFRLRPKRAWVICMHERDASRAYALWEALGGPPFVLHVMDIFHERLSASETPTFSRLVREAKHVICISENIAAEMENNGARSVSFLPCCSDFTAEGRQPLEGPMRIIITGTIWSGVYSNNPALHLLVAAWPKIQLRFPGVELHYAGPSGEKLPDELRSWVHNHGLLDHKAYQDLLRSCHLAYLPVSHPSTTVGRFSVPSRLADYLACGLPTIACTDKDTAIASFLRSLPEGWAVNVADEQGLLNAVRELAEDPVRWTKASTSAASYARDRLRVEKIRAELFRELERC